MAIDYKKADDKQLIALIAGKDPFAAERAKHELDYRNEKRRFWRNFFFPNLWAVLSLLVALYTAYKKETTQTNSDISENNEKETAIYESKQPKSEEKTGMLTPVQK